MQVVYDYLREQFLNAQLHPKIAIYLAALSTFLILSLISLILFFPLRKLFIKIVERFTAHTETIWDDVLFEHKVFHAVAHLIPAIFCLCISRVWRRRFSFASGSHQGYRKNLYHFCRCAKSDPVLGCFAGYLQYLPIRPGTSHQRLTFNWLKS